MNLKLEETFRLFGTCGFEVYAQVYSSVVKYIVYEITGEDLVDPSDVDKELYLKANIKWDECSHWWFGEEDKENPGYLHFCGYNDHLRHVKLVGTLIAKTKEYLDQYTNHHDVSEWKWQDAIDYDNDDISIGAEDNE